jgi:hypothetical protein
VVALSWCCTPLLRAASICGSSVSIEGHVDVTASPSPSVCKVEFRLAGSFFPGSRHAPRGCGHATAHALCKGPLHRFFYIHTASADMEHLRIDMELDGYPGCILSLDMIRSHLLAVPNHDDSGSACPSKVLACVPEQIIRAFLTTNPLPPSLLRQPSPTPKSQNISPYTPYPQHSPPFFVETMPQAIAEL